MNFIKQLLYESGSPSLTRIISVVSIVLFIAVTVYLLINGKTWAHYDTFSNLTAGGGLATQVANKLVNSKYNSQVGEPYQK